MNDQEMRAVLKERGISLVRRRADQQYYAMAAAGDGSFFRRYLGNAATLLSMDSDAFTALIAEKTSDYIGTSKKCAVVQCTRRRVKANRAVLATAIGEVAVLLCEQCYEDYQNSMRGTHGSDNEA